MYATFGIHCVTVRFQSLVISHAEAGQNRTHINLELSNEPSMYSIPNPGDALTVSVSPSPRDGEVTFEKELSSSSSYFQTGDLGTLVRGHPYVTSALRRGGGLAQKKM